MSPSIASILQQLNLTLNSITFQVTFLHLFHHSSITVVVGSILPFDYNGDMYLPIMLNSANHMLVYLHYLLATLGLKVRQSTEMYYLSRNVQTHFLFHLRVFYLDYCVLLYSQQSLYAILHLTVYFNT